MIRLSTKLLSLLALLIFIQTAAEAGQLWPLTEEIDLSSGFGDYRDGHFHFGLDLRTGGISGKKVISPVDGYVSRIRTSYTGYGKALYINGDDGYTYVFAHLANFNNKIENILVLNQIKKERYYQDITFPVDSIRVEKGEFMAFSGKTGIGAPHLHFEKRWQDYPLNPLTHDFVLDDKVAPIFKRVGVHLTDERSLLTNGKRKIYLDALKKGSGNRFIIDTAIYMNHPFGFMVDCYDMMNPKGMKQAVYKLTVYIDGQLFYQVKLDSLDFETNQFVSLEYDYLEVIEKNKYTRRLYKKAGNSFAGSGIFGDGIYGKKGTEKFGIHNVRIVAEDAFQNSSEVNFKFLWGPKEYIYNVDSTLQVARDTTLFYFSPISEYENFGIDSIKAFLNRGPAWGESPDVAITNLDQGNFVCRVIGKTINTAVLRLYLFTSTGVVITDNLFNGLIPKGSGKLKIEHEVLDDGLLVKINVFSTLGSDSRLELYWRDSLLGIESPMYISMNELVCFVPPEKKYSKIDRLTAVMSHAPEYQGVDSDSLYIAAVGFDENEELAVDKYFKLTTSKDNFYEPRFIELIFNPVLNKTKLRMNSDHYQILPNAFVCKDNYNISYKIPWETGINSQSGLCWLNKEKDKWVWLDNSFDNNTLTSFSRGGGSFVAIIDYDAPTISKLTIFDGGSYHNPQPAVNFIIEDTVSGIEDDRDIRIEVDGQWLIPEYDPESGWVRSKPLEPLMPGRHHLGIMVTDRAGNLYEQYLNFYVKKRK